LSAPVIIGLAFGLAMDAFAVAITAGIILPQITARHYFRLSFHFGLFQSLMPVIGWLAGNTFASYIESWDHWIAFGLLFYVGGKMIHESLRKRDNSASTDPTRGSRLVTLSIATSIDALAIGMSLAVLGVEIVEPAIYIGVITMILTMLGMRLGRRLGRLFGRWIEKAGGLVLIGIGFKILIQHLMG